MRKIILTRITIGMILGILIAGIVSELSFYFIGDRTSRAPQVVEFVIPAGTSEKVALGESILPKEQNFVVGDTLVVKNEDTVAHILGPLFIPAWIFRKFEVGSTRKSILYLLLPTHQAIWIDRA